MEIHFLASSYLAYCDYDGYTLYSNASSEQPVHGAMVGTIVNSVPGTLVHMENTCVPMCRKELWAEKRRIIGS